MAFKKRAVGVATRPAPRGPGPVPTPSAEPVHMIKQTMTKSGGPPKVETACGLQETPYRGKGTGGCRTTIWPGEVTCPDCHTAPSINLWRSIKGLDEDDSTSVATDD